VHLHYGFSWCNLPYVAAMKMEVLAKNMCFLADLTGVIWWVAAGSWFEKGAGIAPGSRQGMTGSAPGLRERLDR
jgi:hypothetical protein